MIIITRHARRKMNERGVLEHEIADTVGSGELVEVKGRRQVRRRVFTSGYEYEGRAYDHKELKVVYVEEGDSIVVLTAIARYGRWENLI